MRRAPAYLASVALVAALITAVSAQAAAADPAPRLTVNPNGDWISGQGFTPYAAATFTRNGEPIAGGPPSFVDYGNVWFQVDFDILPGDVISLGDGTITKTLTVTNLSVTGITETTVSGTASGSSVHLWVNGVNVTRTVLVTGGTWATDVSKPGLQPGDQGTIPTLDPGANGGVQESDADGDATHADWNVPDPRIMVCPDGDWVNAMEFAEGVPATVTITRGDLTVVDAAEMQPGGGPGLWFQDPESTEEPFDLQAGDVVTVTSGAVTKGHTVTGLDVTGIDGNIVRGVASGAEVGLNVWDTDVSRREAVVGGTWMIDVSVVGNDPWEQATTELGPGMGGSVEEWDGDGDSTTAQWRIPAPRFTVDPENQWVEGFEFTPDATIAVSRGLTRIDDGSITADGEGYFWWDSPEPLPVGATITVDDGVGSKTHVVTNVAIDSVVDSVVSGRASGEWVSLWGEEGCNRNVTVVGGAWSENLADQGDEDWETPCAPLGPGSEIGVEETDEDGDGTQANWRIPEPSIAAILNRNRVVGREFGDPVTITLYDPAGPRTAVWDSEGIEYWDDGFDLYLDYSSPADGPWTLQPGQTITVVGPNGTKSLVVADLRVDGWDYDTETAWGTTDQTGPVTLEAMHADKEYDSFMLPPVDGHWEIGLIDIRIMDEGGVWQFDEDGDTTNLEFTFGPTRFLFSPLFQQIVGSDWVDGSTVTLTVDPQDPATPDFTATRVAGPLDCNVRWACPNWQVPLTGEVNVFFDLNDTGFQARAGDVITMTDGTTEKTLAVPDLSVNLPDLDADTVSGTTTSPMPGFLTVRYQFDDGEDYCEAAHDILPEDVGGDGAWSRSLAGECDMRTGGSTSATETDLDGDQTWITEPTIDLRVDPAADRIWAAWWTDTDVTLTIERGGSPVLTRTVATQNVLTRGSWNLDMWAQPVGTLDTPMMALFDLGADAFDIRAGDVLTVTDGTITRSTTVAVLTVDSIDAAADTVSGTAAAGQVVSFHLDDGEEGYWGYQTTADAAGAWTFQFDPNGFPGQGLDPGMIGQAFGPDNVTVIRWTVPAGIATATTVLGDAPDPSVVGQSYLVRVSVKRTGTGSGLPQGTVTIADGSGASCTDTTSTRVDARASEFSCALRSTSAGAKTLTATFNPGAGWAGSTGSAAHQVKQAATATTITNAPALASKTTRVGEAYSVAVKVAVLGPGSGVPTGSVVVSDGSATCTVAVLSASGTGSCTLTSTSAGLKTITARYAGTSDFGPSAATVKHRVR